MLVDNISIDLYEAHFFMANGLLKLFCLFAKHMQIHSDGLFETFRKSK